MIPDVSIYRDNAARTVSGTQVVEASTQSNKGFVKTIILLIVLLVLLQIAGVDLSRLGALATVALAFLWEIFTVLFSFFIEVIKQAIEALRELLGMRS